MMLKLEFKKMLDKAFSGQFTSEHLDFLKNMTTKLISLKETGVTAKNYNHWKKNGLVIISETNSEKRRWERLSFVEYLWLKCVEEMREFGLPLIRIRQAKDLLFSDVDLEYAFKVSKDLNTQSKHTLQKQRLNELLNKLENIQISEKDKEALKLFLTSENYNKELLKEMKINYFETAFLSSINYRQEFGILITKKDIFPILEELFSIDSNIKTLFYEPHLYISVTALYYSFLTEEQKKDYVSSFALLSEEEKAILAFMRKEKFQNIRIDRNKTETFLTGEMKKECDAETFRQINKSIVTQYKFTEVGAKRRDGKITAIVISIKEKIKK